MDFQRLRIVNFLTIGDSGDLHLSGRGLNLLQGVNDDDPSAMSNGAGKSSVPDALCWALFGTTARGEQGDAVVNATKKKGCVVEVLLQDGSTTYRIKRTRKPNALTVESLITAKDGTPGSVNLTKGTEKETQLVIDGILGCSYEVFMAAIYAGQEAMPDLPAMTDKQLKLLIEEAAGVQKLERAYEIARSKESSIRSQIENNESALQRAQGQLHAANVDLEGAKLKHAAFEGERAGMAQSLTREGDALHAEAARLIAAIQAQDEPTVKAERDKIAGELAGINALRAAADAYRRGPLQQAQSALTVAKAQHQQLLTAAQRVRAIFDNAEVEMAKPCTECGKPHTPDELETFKAHTKQRLVAAVEAAQAAAHAIVPLDESLTARHVEHQRLESLVPDATDLSTRDRALGAVLAQLAGMKGTAHATLERTKAKREAANRALTERNPHESVIAHLAGQIKTLQETVDNRLLVKDQLAVEFDVAQAVTKVFSPAGVRAHILDTVTPFLNDRTAEYLSTLSDGNISAVWSTLSKTAKGELREKFVIEVENDKGAKSFRGLSGGEKRKVRLASMMALQDLVASRATKPLNLWIGDEIDDALDAAGLERLMTILERKARDKGTVLVISHRELRDWIDEVTVVRKAGGSSTVEGALAVA
jgi:DNA repair exonuclease SbcCD ATPase subunit